MTVESADLAMELLTLSRQALLTGFLVFLRVGAAMALLPVFGEQSVPVRVRLALALAFTVIVMPAVSGRLAPMADEGLLTGVPLATETLAGLAIGMVLRLFILALQMAGTIAAQSTSLAQFFGGAGVEPQPAISQLLVVTGLALAAMAGLHVKLAELMVLSYDILPAGVFPGAGDLSGWGVGQITRAVALAFSLAAPFVIASLIYNVALGVINRAMPQLMVSFVGAPALALGGLVLLLLGLPLAMALWVRAFDGFLANPFAVMP